MLVLSRKVNEAIWIGDDIEVYVTAIAGDKVRLGVTAPRHLRIDRHEVRAAMIAEAAETQTTNDTPEVQP